MENSADTGTKIFSRKERHESGAASLGVLPEKSGETRRVTLLVAVATPRSLESKDCSSVSRGS